MDLRFDAEGRPHLLEVNPLPGLNPESGELCIMAGDLGVSYPAPVGGIIDEAILRNSELA